MERIRSLAIILLCIGLAVRFVGLDYPREVVFDEVHFGKFINSYCCSGENFFDIHPPHGKLLIAAAARLGGYRGEAEFTHIGEEYPAGTAVSALRALPALAGGILPLVIFFLLLHAGVRSEVAFAGGLAVALDNALVLASRVIALDPILLLAGFGSLLAFLKAEKAGGSRALFLFITAGALAGLAAGVKFTGLSALALLGLLTLWHLARSRSSGEAYEWLKRGLIVLIAAAIMYLLGWIIHFASLTQPGAGDVWLTPSGAIFQDIPAIHRIMFDANYNLGATHPYASAWWSWPLMQRPVFYWQGSDGGKLYLIGNPVVWWGGIALFVLAIASTLLRWIPHQVRDDLAVAKSISNYSALFLIGYLVSYIPLMRVPRVLFLYHYFTPLLFSLLVGVAWLGSNYSLQTTHYKLKIILVVACIAAGFVLFSPLTYGFPAPSWQPLLVWFSSWR